MGHRQPQQPVGNAVVLGTPRRDVPKTGLADAKRVTGHPNGDPPALHGVMGHLATTRWPYHFFARASATISALSFSSTYNFFSRAFSPSSSFIRAINETSMPPYFARHL